MKHSSQAEKVLAQINPDTKLGDLRKISAEIKKDHKLALELWSTGQFLPRLLSILIMDRKQLSQPFIDDLDREISQHPYGEKLQLIDWLMANQLSKEKKVISYIEKCESSPT